MTTIHLFTPIDYTRPRSYSEGALSTLSNYFYLGGDRATVIRGDEVRLEPGKISCHTIALKVASYVLLFPLTLPLLAIYAGLRYQHHFTVISEPTSPPVLDTPQNESGQTASNVENRQQKIVEPLPVTSGANVVAQTVEKVREEILIPPPVNENLFHSFTITVTGESLYPISSKEDMRSIAQEIRQQVLDKHSKLRIEIPSNGPERKQALIFIEELKNVVDVIPTQLADWFYVQPKHTEETKEDLTIRKYDNGVVEEVQSSKKDAWDCWQGRRIYPNGKIETGKFDHFYFESGTSVENDVITYRQPETLVESEPLGIGLMYAEIEEKKQLIAIREKPGSDKCDSDYIQVNEGLIPTLAQILQEEDVCDDTLEEILSGPINCEEFIKFLFKENFIFSLGKSNLKIVLKNIQEKGLTVNLRQQNPRTKKTLLDRYIMDGKMRATLLAIDPSLTEEANKILLLKPYKDKLESFFPNQKNPEQIAAELFQNIPESLELTELVDFIFKKCSRFSILSLLDALLIAQPSFTLSPCDKIRKAIIEDKQHSLTNSSLIAMFKEHKLDNNHEKMSDCYELAYRLNHPYIYPPSPTPVPSNDYSLNFLWVNLNPQDRVKDVAQNIFGDGLNLSENADCINNPKALRDLEEKEQSLENEELENWNKIKKSFTYRISRWADVNPGAQINLWYDSALVTEKAQQTTFEMMKTLSASRGVNLKLKDIRRLPNITGEIEHSLHPGTQVYYRVDMLKVLIADYMISSSEESAKYCVVSDIDVKPMTPRHMFDKRTVDYLSSNGYVFNRVGLLGHFENSFFIFNKEKKDLQEIHHKTMIKWTKAHIAELRNYAKDASFKPDYILDSQFIYKQYFKFRTKMGEGEFGNELEDPRKVVECPPSQFNSGGHFSKSDYQAETFRFIGNSNIPYTRHGRNFNDSGSEGQIEALKNWTAEPLSLV